MLLINDQAFSELPRWKYNRLAPAPFSPGWTESAMPESKIHRIHAYPARFPAFLVNNAFNYAEQQGVEVKRVADVFCGSGTVAYEAAARSIEFWGCDINPVATLIARVKGSRFEPSGFEESAYRIVKQFEVASRLPALSVGAIQKLVPWYEPSQFDDLARLSNAILSEIGGESEEAMAFQCAFSAILKPASQWRLRSIKPSKDHSKRPLPVLEAFRRQCRLMATAWSEIAHIPRPESKIVCGNVIEVERPSSAIDLIVTSPPYATSYEYADLHQLSALWLGFVDDHRDLRPGVIGTSSRRANLATAIRDLNSVGLQIVFSLFDKDRGLAEAVARYFLDMQKVAKRCHDFLRSGGISVFVIGNTQLNGVRIDNANHLVESLLEAGFIDVRVVKRHLSNKPNTPYRLPNGRLSSSRTTMEIYAEEYIVMAKRR
ncbi:class I SAM-dependent methyltransferase [Rhizobium leguminosarum]|uniref:class I SAM-dependent methyltransferase n=1 Tax=Rhizobium leguminosarum TaxID=384 RepID=UPI001C979D49|nr:class I SAM-dependent methyltransferase [Rhizobium leguminosarum]MBY5337016.1 class I SAM-dependent methyltransferase [Rhizobium leguminosarum]